MLLIIDNYDSFTYNLYQYFCELGVDVHIVRNDKIDIAGIKALQPNYLVISPGPGDPNSAGISLEVIRHFAGSIPILGICLGHQAIAQIFGGDIVRARKAMHGKISPVYHTKQNLFYNLQNPLNVTRYHSLVVKCSSFPQELELTAWTQKDDGTIDEIMGFKHKTLPLYAVQFHPESIKTEQGHALLKNFLQQR